MDRYNAQNECKVANSVVGHPNIIKISEFKHDFVIIDGIKDKRSFAILEYCKNGDLYEYMTSYLGTQSEEDFKGMMAHDKTLLRSLMEQIINGMSALHKSGYAHLDIKLENVLISNEGILKLCDFGFSTYTNSLISKVVGTATYMAPEIHTARAQPCNAKISDIFSLGDLFFILAFGAPPFHTAQASDTYFRYLQMKPGNTDFFKFHPHTKKLFRQGLICKSFQKVLIQMLQVDPNLRLQDLEELKSQTLIDSDDRLSIEESAQFLLKSQ